MDLSPPAPQISSVVQLQDCLEELLEYTLISSTQGKIQCGISNAYCTNLLRADPSDPLPTNDELTPVRDDLSFKRNQDEWNKLIVEEGTTLMKMLKEVDFELHVQEPLFSQLSDGLKIVEGRGAVGVYRSCLLTHWTWLNIHIVPPHGIVLEIIIAEGYGARWSEDGTKFIEFIEPYMVDGFLKGWKH